MLVSMYVIKNAYASRALHKHELNYPITELEILGLVWAVKYFRAYLLGHNCVVLTDHSACTTSCDQSISETGSLGNEMDLEIKHRPGKPIIVLMHFQGIPFLMLLWLLCRQYPQTSLLSSAVMLS